MKKINKMNKKILVAVALVGSAMTSPANAVTTFNATFENVPGGPTSDGQALIIFSGADGFSGTNGIELQRRAAGSPAANGGSVFVELDVFQNSAIFRTIDAGTYNLSLLYSARPGTPAATNVLEILLDGTLLLPPIADEGGVDTAFRTISTSFTAAASSTLTFRAAGTSDGLGVYVDNISLAAVPEPATWAMMMMGFGGIGVAMRRKAKVDTRIRFA